MEKKETRIKVAEEEMNYLESVFVDYKSKQDIINFIFENHKFDDDDSVIHGKPFKTYERQFAEAKFKCELVMGEIQDKYIPDSLKKENYKWEADFTNKELIVTEI